MMLVDRRDVGEFLGFSSCGSEGVVRLERHREGSLECGTKSPLPRFWPQIDLLRLRQNAQP